MKGPDTTDIDNILEELQLKPVKEDTDRFEIMSSLSGDNKSQTSLMSSLLSTNKKGKK